MEKEVTIPGYKRYMVFAMEQYYPCGGLVDVKTSFDVKDEAIRYLNEVYCDWGYVFDRIEGITVHDKQ